MNRTYLRLELERLADAPTGETAQEWDRRRTLVAEYTRLADLLAAADLEAGMTTARRARDIPPVHLLSFIQNPHGRAAMIICFGPADTAESVSWRVARPGPDLTFPELTGEMVDAAEDYARGFGATAASVLSVGHDELHRHSGASDMQGAQPISSGQGFSRLRNPGMLFAAVRRPAALRPGPSGSASMISAYMRARGSNGEALREVEVFAPESQAAAMKRYLDASIVTFNGRSLRARRAGDGSARRPI